MSATMNERVANLVRRLVSRGDRERRRQQASSITQRLQRLRDCRVALISEVNRARGLCCHGIGDESDYYEVSFDSLAKAHQLRDGLSTPEQSSLIHSDPAFAALLSAMPTVTRALADRNIANRVRFVQKVRENAPNETTLAVLALQDGASTVVAEIRRGWSRLEEAVEEDLESPKRIQQAVECWQTYQQCRAAVEQIEMDEDVKAFLSDVMRGGAPLSALNGTLLAKLAAMGLTASLVVGFGASSGRPADRRS